MARKLTETEANAINIIINSGSFDMPVKAEKIRADIGLSKRALEEVIESLRVTHNHPIVAKKTQPSGYYIPKTESERLIGTAPYSKQILTEQRNLTAVLSVDLAKYWEGS